MRKQLDALRFLSFVAFLVTMSASAAAGISRQDFPPGFIFGAGTSAYQVEGAAAEDGRKPSIWDTYAHAGQGLDKRTADVAADQYHKYKEDVQLMRDMGLDAYRFSISWSRLIPDGRGSLNPKGLQYYNNLIDELIARGIQPHVTLCQFDVPQALEDEYTGLLSPKIIEDFTAYANVCFAEFGDRVKHWTTFNEPNAQAVIGYDLGIFTPARCSSPFGTHCSAGDSTTEPYISAHNMLLAHASAARLYKSEYQAKQHGYIGITLLALWIEPWTTSPADRAAARRAIDFHIGWYMDPLLRGTYPEAMRKRVGSRLPHISRDEAEQIRASYDFIGLNHYFVVYVKNYGQRSGTSSNKTDYLRDISASIPTEGLIFPFDSLNPWSLQKLLEYVKLKYANPPVVIYENGYGNLVVSPKDQKDDNLNDQRRVEYLEAYLSSLLLSLRNGSNTIGYFVWSFIDCFEVVSGYGNPFGLYMVDFKDRERKRYPRDSARWYSNFLRGGGATETIEHNNKSVTMVTHREDFEQNRKWKSKAE